MPPLQHAIRILVCDDHDIVREGLKRVLGDPSNGAPELHVMGEAASGDEVLAQVEAHHGNQGLDLVLLDIGMPRRDGMELLQALRRQWPALPVLMLSIYPERQYAVRCIRLGAAGYLHKSADADTMVAAMRKAAAGGRYISPATADALALEVGAGPAAAALSQREVQVLRLLMKGHGVGEIGAALGLAANTVSTYRARILRKTGTRNNVERALYAERMGRGDTAG